MPKIRYIPIGWGTGLEVRDENGAHLYNILPSEYMKSKEAVHRESFVCRDCEFTYDDLLEAIHKLWESRHDD